MYPLTILIIDLIQNKQNHLPPRRALRNTETVTSKYHCQDSGDEVDGGRLRGKVGVPPQLIESVGRVEVVVGGGAETEELVVAAPCFVPTFGRTIAKATVRTLCLSRRIHRLEFCEQSCDSLIQSRAIKVAPSYVRVIIT